MKVMTRRNSLVPEFDVLLNNVLNGDFYMNQTGMHKGHLNYPAVNISETNDAYKIELAAPGYQKDSFSIKIDNHILTISSNTDANAENDIYLKREFNYGSFERKFTLPKNKIEESQIKASYENGVLNIELTKKEEAKPLPVREISIA